MYSTLISTDALAHHLDDPKFVVVDVRHDLAHPDWGEKEFHKAHIPGAGFAHIDRDLSAKMTGSNGRHPLPSPSDAAQVFGRLGIDRTRQVVVYDQGSGMFSSRLWWMLRWLGHEAVALLDGGYAKWTREGRAVTAEPPLIAPTEFDVTHVTPTVNATGISASLPRHTLLLLDARAAERFRGDTEPIDPVAGHIPGAINRPYTQNLARDGTFRPARELRAEFEAMLHGRTEADVVHYCGSGVASCHNVLAMVIAGYPLTRLYPGSWSEWVSDRARPISARTR
jgi:thiosulfate/3-mercaptopyruvate sulfurtransferase